ncbi:MAG: hypothetical protein WAV93_08525 [Bacteroidales bacterium]
MEEISRDVGRQEITFMHMRDELTDHICCDAEEMMRGGWPLPKHTPPYRRGWVHEGCVRYGKRRSMQLTPNTEI